MQEDDNVREEAGTHGRCVWVLASAPVADAHELAKRLPRPDKVIAADGGSSLAVELGLVPDLVIGDFDSSLPTTVQEQEAGGSRLRKYEHDLKWETDTELAVLAALDFQPESILILGALGGRLDHTLANVLLLAHPELQSIDVRLVGDGEEVFLAKPGRWNIVRGGEGDIVSLLPLSDEVVGILLEGLQYPLNKETLYKGKGRGVSNRLLGEEGRIWLESGQLLVVRRSSISEVES